jgi:hypothetical protein
MQARSKTATGRLEAAQAALADATRQIGELGEKRNAALLKDADADAAKFAGEIENLQRLAHGYQDKIALLQEAAAEEERARKVKEHAALIGRIEAKIEQRNKAMEEVATAIKQLATASEQAIRLGREVIAAWNWPAHDLAPALLTPPSILNAIAHESFRCSYHPRRYGGMDTDPLAGLMLPGSKSPRIETMEAPEHTRPLIDAVREASEFAKRFLRSGKSSAVEPAAVPAPAPVSANGGTLPSRSAAEERLAALLKRQAVLAEDVSADEREYQGVVAQIAQAQAEIDAARKMET